MGPGVGQCCAERDIVPSAGTAVLQPQTQNLSVHCFLSSFPFNVFLCSLGAVNLCLWISDQEGEGSTDGRGAQ